MRCPAPGGNPDRAAGFSAYRTWPAVVCIMLPVCGAMHSGDSLIDRVSMQKKTCSGARARRPNCGPAWEKKGWGVACPAGIEPATHSLEGCCSIQLSYGQIRDSKGPERAFVFFEWSERRDSNSRPSAPKADALPGCATLRLPAILPVNAAPSDGAQRFSYWVAPKRFCRAFSSTSGLRASASTSTAFCTAGRAAILSNQTLRWG